jgi:N-acetylmuramoyl-L-alanine amidase
MKIAIDLGHGVGQDRGAEGIVTEESIINSVGSLVIAKLKALGHTVIETRPQYANSVSDSLIKRVDLANSNNVDLYVSIHANAGGGRGTEVFTYRGQEVVQAREVLNNITELGFINRGIKSSNLYVINKTEARAMLIEICFVDTKTDMELYNSIGAEKVANAIVEGLVGETVTIAPIDKKEHIQEQYKGSTWVSRLQYIIGANKDGIAGKETLSKCPVLKKGNVGDVVKLLQENLKIIADGIFGTNTREAVLAFQINNGLVVDGIVGKNTWRKLLGL